VLPWIIRAIIIFLSIALYGSGAPVNYRWHHHIPHHSVVWVWCSRRLYVLSSYLQHSVGLVLPWIIHAIIIFLNIALYGSGAPVDYRCYHHIPQHSVVWVCCSRRLYVLTSYLQHSVGLILPWIIRAIIIILKIALYGSGASVNYRCHHHIPHHGVVWVWCSRRLYVLSSFVQHSVGLVLPWIIRDIIIFLNIALYGSDAPRDYTCYHHTHNIALVWWSRELYVLSSYLQHSVGLVLP
jgi:hypothetical protein